MSGRMRVCRTCDRYTLHDACPKCKSATTTPHPAKFSPQDHYGRYRRRLKRMDADAAKPPKGVGRPAAEDGA